MLYLNFSSVVDKNALVVGTGGGSVSPFSSHKFSIHTDSNSCRFFHFAVPLSFKRLLFEDCKYKQHINALINLEHGTVSIASQHIREAESLHVFSLHRDKYEFHFFI